MAGLDYINVQQGRERKPSKGQGWESWGGNLVPQPLAGLPPHQDEQVGRACVELLLLVDRTPGDGHINKAHKKCTNIKSYKH